MNFHCDDCGDIDYVLLDGYAVGDRLLEGVMFEMRHKNGKYDVVAEKRSEPYFKQLNAELWLKRIAKHAEQWDVAQCPKCKGDVYAD